MIAYEIPLTAEAQTFDIALAGVTYHMTLAWNPVLYCWVLDIATEDQVPLLMGVPVVTGLDLLAQYRHLGFGGHLIVQTSAGLDANTELDQNSTVPVVGPGDWFIIGVSILGGPSALWGPNSGSSITGDDPTMQANIFPNDVPDFNSLGTTGRIYFVVT